MSEAERTGTAGMIALLVLGLVILIPSSLCTGFLGIGALVDTIANPANAGDGLSVMAMALVIGGPFVATGAVLVWFAIRRLRR